MSRDPTLYLEDIRESCQKIRSYTHDMTFASARSPSLRPTARSVEGQPQLLHASRKRRIASGSGTSVQEINKLLKQHKQMQIMMKRVKKMGGAEKFMARGLPPGLLPR